MADRITEIDIKDAVGETSPDIYESYEAYLLELYGSDAEAISSR